MKMLANPDGDGVWKGWRVPSVSKRMSAFSTVSWMPSFPGLRYSAR